MSIFKRIPPNDAFAAQEQARAENLTAFVAKNGDRLGDAVGYWHTAAQAAQRNAAANTEQPKKAPRPRRWGR